MCWKPDLVGPRFSVPVWKDQYIQDCFLFSGSPWVSGIETSLSPLPVGRLLSVFLLQEEGRFLGRICQEIFISTAYASQSQKLTVW